MFVELFKNKILPRHYGHEMAISSITDDSRSNTQAITLNLDPLCSLYKKNTTAWVNELVGMRKILEDQAEISEDEILGVRAPGLTPGFNAQYEVDIAYHTFPDFNFPCHFYSQYPGADRLWFHLGLQPRSPPASDPCLAVHL